MVATQGAMNVERQTCLRLSPPALSYSSRDASEPRVSTSFFPISFFFQSGSMLGVIVKKEKSVSSAVESKIFARCMSRETDVEERG